MTAALPVQAQITGTGAAGALEATGLTATNSCTFPCNYGNTTVPAGSNRMGLFSVGIHGSGSSWASETLTVGGQSATKIHNAHTSTVGFATFCILDAALPAPGSQAVVVGGTIGGLSSNGQSAIITWLFGAKQTCPPALADALGNISSVESVSTTLTPTVNGSLFYHYAAAGGDRLSTMAATSPQVLLAEAARAWGRAHLWRQRRHRRNGGGNDGHDDMDERHQRIPGRPDRQPRAGERSCATNLVIRGSDDSQPQCVTNR